MEKQKKQKLFPLWIFDLILTCTMFVFNFLFTRKKNISVTFRNSQYIMIIEKLKIKLLTCYKKFLTGYVSV